MKYYMPAKVYAETDCVENHADELAHLGRKALIVTGKHSAEANGSLEDVVSALEKSGTEWCRFSEVEENPSVDTVMKARDRGVEEGVDFVIGIGGGSPMDAAKAAALMIRHRDQGAGFLYGNRTDHAAVPIAEVPTTCGTGSEVTGVSVLTRPKLGAKGSIPHVLFPDLALIDGKYLKTAPVRVLADTSMDTLAHLMESQFHSKSTVFSRMCSETGLARWAMNRQTILEAVSSEENLLDGQSAMSLMIASAFGGMSIAQTGTSIPHCMSYSLTLQAHVAHGKACGYFLPGYLAEADPAKVKRALRLAGFSSVSELEEYYEKTCGRDRYAPEVIETSIQAVLQNPSRKAAAPFPVDEAAVRRIASYGG